MDNIYLRGSEDVRNAGSAMREAAAEMSRAAMNIQGTADQQQRFLDDWLMRFTDTVETLAQTLAVKEAK
jgi:hypothetical protein